MNISIIGAGGNIVNCNLHSKISEIYDSIYLEVDSVKEKYKDIIKGIVVDKTKFEYILSSLVSIFKCNSVEELVQLLNELNSSFHTSPHIKFFLNRFELSKHLYKSIDKILSSTGTASVSLYDDLYFISSHYSNKNLLDLLNKFVDRVHLCRFENEEMAEFKKNNPSSVFINMEKNSLKGAVELNRIILSIDRLYELHRSMFCDINEVYKIMMDITHILNSELE